MRKLSIIFLGLPLALAILTAGCGSTGNGGGGNANDVPVVVTMHDAPPTGTTLLSFQITVTGLTLNQGTTGSGSGSSSASLISSPVTIQLQDLQTQTELLALSKAPAGTYDSATITFSTAQATFLNTSGSTQTVGTVSCSNGQVCQVTPTISTMSDTISNAPFPLTITKGTPVSLSIDFDTNSSLGSDFSISPTVTIAASTTALANGDLVDVGGINGQITKVGNNTVTLTDSNTGQSLNLNTTSSTTFNGFTNCTANNSTCLANNQIVTADVGASTGNPTALTASNFNGATGFTQGVTGTVVAVNPAQNTMTIVVTGSTPADSNVTTGAEQTVNLANNVTFSANTGGATIPSGLNFNSVNDVVVGQSVMVDATNVSGNTITADNVMLEPTQFTGTESGINGTTVTLGGLNGLFTGAGTNSVAIDTGTGTTFGGVTGVTSITAGDEIDAGGLLFNSATGPTLVATQFNDTTAMNAQAGVVVRRQ